MFFYFLNTCDEREHDTYIKERNEHKFKLLKNFIITAAPF